MKFFLVALFFLVPILARARPDLPKPYVTIPVVIDGRTRAQIWAFPRTERRAFALEAEPLLAVLKEFLRPELYNRLAKKQTLIGTLSLQDLDALGFTNNFSEERLELEIQIPLKYRKSSDLDLTFDEDSERKYQRPHSPSGYLNIRTNQRFTYGNNRSTNSNNVTDGATDSLSDNLLPLTGRLDFVENIHGWVFESGTEFNDRQEYPWRRADTHVVVDAESSMVRMTVGDFNVIPKSFQSSANLAGISIARQFSIQPYRTAKPLSDSELIIKRPSLVELYINGVLYTQIRLNPGRFNIKDFPVVNGQNDVRVHIKDDLGQEEDFNFSVLFENTLLAEGLHEFGYFGGATWRDSGGDRAYDNRNLQSSFFHRYGFTSSLTAGINFQNWGDQNLGGAEASLATPVGFFSLEAAYSQNTQVLGGYAGRFRYRSLDRIMGYDTKNIVSLEYEQRDLNFHAISVPTLSSNIYQSRSDIQISRRLTDTIFAGVGGAYEKAFEPNHDRRTYRANIVVPLTSRFRVEGNYSESYAPMRDAHYFLSLYWVDMPGIYSVSAYYDSLNSTRNLAINRSNRRKFDDVSFNASLQQDSEGTSSNLSADLLTQPASLRLENYSSRSALQTSNTALLGINTGIAWVGEHFAFTQPVQDSFALITSENLPTGQVLPVNSTFTYADAQLGLRNSAVLSEYTAYYQYAINLDSTALPMGYLLAKEYYYVQPTYHSGLLIRVRLDSKIMVKGRLLKSNQQPAALVVGDIFDENGRLIDNNFFTNREGGFLIEGLTPGRYFIQTAQKGIGKIQFVVTQPANNFLVLDSLIAPGDQDASTGAP